MDEARLIEKLRLIEALFAGATTEGEKVAAERARGRILERLQRLEREDPPVEYRFSMPDMWSRKVFVALMRRYGLVPYRYNGQRYTTVMARVSQRFVDETLWPEFRELSDSLHDYLSEVTDRVVHQVIHPDSSEAAVVEKPKQLPLGVDRAGAGAAGAPGAAPGSAYAGDPDVPTSAPGASDAGDPDVPSGPGASEGRSSPDEPRETPSSGGGGKGAAKKKRKKKRKGRRGRLLPTGGGSRVRKMADLPRRPTFE